MIDALYFLLVALIVSLALVALGRRAPGPWAGFLSFFVIILFAAWAASLWLIPAGPVFYEVYWVGPLLTALLLGSLLAAVLPSSRSAWILRKREHGPPETPARRATRLALASTAGVFFWVTITALIVVILIGINLD